MRAPRWNPPLPLQNEGPGPPKGAQIPVWENVMHLKGSIDKGQSLAILYGGLSENSIKKPPVGTILRPFRFLWDLVQAGTKALSTWVKTPKNLGASYLELGAQLAK